MKPVSDHKVLGHVCLLGAMVTVYRLLQECSGVMHVPTLGNREWQ